MSQHGRKPMIAHMSTRVTAPASLAALVLLLTACSWDGPGVQVGAPTDANASRAPAELVDVPSESLPPASLPEASPISATSAPPELANITLPPGARRPLPADLPATVAVVGDSLTLAASDEIRSALDAVGVEAIAIDGAENRRMIHGAEPAPGLDSITTIASEATPELWVVALGTNDVGAASDPDSYAGDVRRLLDEIPEAAPVVWVDVWIRDRKPAVERANEALREVLAERPGAIVADWYSHGDDAGLVTIDGVHLTADGRRVFAATIVDAVLALSA